MLQQYADHPWPRYEFKDLLPEESFVNLNGIPSEEFTRGTDHDCTDLSYYNVTDMDVIDLFRDLELIKTLQDTFDVSLTPFGAVRALMSEVIDYRGVDERSIHCDAPAKILSIVIYLGQHVLRECGTWLYDINMSCVQKPDHIPNAGFIFKKQDNVTWHTIPEISKPEQLNRRTLVVNYIKQPNRLERIQNPDIYVDDYAYPIRMNRSDLL